MKQPQLFFNQTLKTNQEMKELKTMLKDALGNSHEYQKLTEEIKTLQARRKEVQNAIYDDFSSEIDKLSTLKLDLDNDKMLMSDSALAQLVNGETVEVEDKYGNKYEPTFTVKFKKIK